MANAIEQKFYHSQIKKSPFKNQFRSYSFSILWTNSKLTIHQIKAILEIQDFRTHTVKGEANSTAWTRASTYLSYILLPNTHHANCFSATSIWKNCKQWCRSCQVLPISLMKALLFFLSTSQLNKNVSKFCQIIAGNWKDYSFRVIINCLSTLKV